MMLVLLLCFSSLFRSAQCTHSTQKDSANSNLSVQVASLLQTKYHVHSLSSATNGSSSLFGGSAGAGKPPIPYDKHVSQKCLTRKSSSSDYFSFGQSCCAATTQVAACLDGYRLVWTDECCAIGAEFGIGCAG